MDSPYKEPVNTNEFVEGSAFVVVEAQPLTNPEPFACAVGDEGGGGRPRGGGCDGDVDAGAAVVVEDEPMLKKRLGDRGEVGPPDVVAGAAAVPVEASREVVPAPLSAA